MSGLEERLFALLAGAKIAEEEKRSNHLKQFLETIEEASIIDLSNFKVSLSGLRVLLPLIQRNSFLTTLNLSDNLLNDVIVEDLAAVLESSESLNALDLSGNSFSEVAIERLFTALKEKKLTHLSMNKARLNDQGVKALVNILDFSALASLELRQNAMGDEAVKALCTVLERDTPLVNLDLSHNHITHAGVQIFSEALRKHSSLTVLSLSNNWIESGAYLALLRIFDTNTILTTLKLDFNYMSPQQLTEINMCLEKNRRLVDEMFLAVRSGQDSVLKSLIESKASVASLQNWGEKPGYTPLMVAAQFNQLSSVKVLLQKRHPGFWQQSEAPLKENAEKKKEEAAKKYEQTALEIAEMKQHGEIACLIWREMRKACPTLRKKEIDLAKRLNALTSIGLPAVLGQLVLEYVYQKSHPVSQSVALGGLYLKLKEVSRDISESGIKEEQNLSL